MTDQAPWYDDPKCMTEKCGSIEGLRELFNARHEAYYERKEALNDWVALGRWQLDRCGNAMRITEGLSTEEANQLDPIITWDQLWRDIPQGRMVSSSWNTDMPPADSVCKGCKRGWVKVSDLDDIYFQRHINEFAAWHKGCWDVYKRGAEQEFFRDVFTKAGYKDIQLAEVPNEYCPCEHCKPWFKVVTKGGIIKIGWRKRVINIDWSLCEVDGSNLFPEEDVTKGANFIHAWGKDKAIKYLSVLGENFK